MLYRDHIHFLFGNWYANFLTQLLSWSFAQLIKLNCHLKDVQIAALHEILSKEISILALRFDAQLGLSAAIVVSLGKKLYLFIYLFIL